MENFGGMTYGEFSSIKFEEYLRNEGIQCERVVLKTLEQNCVAERQIWQNATVINCSISTRKTPRHGMT